MIDVSPIVAQADEAANGLIDQGNNMVAAGQSMLARGQAAGSELIAQGNALVGQGQAALADLASQGEAVASGIVQTANATIQRFDSFIAAAGQELGQSVASVGSTLAALAEPIKSAVADAFQPWNEMAETITFVPKTVLSIVQGAISLPAMVVGAYNDLAAEIHEADWRNKGENLMLQFLTWEAFVKEADRQGEVWPQARIRGLDRIFRYNTVVPTVEWEQIMDAFDKAWHTPNKYWQMPWFAGHWLPGEEEVSWRVRLSQLSAAEREEAERLGTLAFFRPGIRLGDEDWSAGGRRSMSGREVWGYEPGVISDDHREPDQFYNARLIQLLGPGWWIWEGFSLIEPDGRWSEVTTQFARLSSPDYMARLVPFTGADIYKRIVAMAAPPNPPYDPSSRRIWNGTGDKWADVPLDPSESYARTSRPLTVWSNKTRAPRTVARVVTSEPVTVDVEPFTAPMVQPVFYGAVQIAGTLPLTGFGSAFPVGDGTFTIRYLSDGSTHTVVNRSDSPWRQGDPLSFEDAIRHTQAKVRQLKAGSYVPQMPAIPGATQTEVRQGIGLAVSVRSGSISPANLPSMTPGVQKAYDTGLKGYPGDGFEAGRK